MAGNPSEAGTHLVALSLQADPWEKPRITGPVLLNCILLRGQLETPTETNRGKQIQELDRVATATTVKVGA